MSKEGKVLCGLKLFLLFIIIDIKLLKIVIQQIEYRTTNEYLLVNI